MLRHCWLNECVLFAGVVEVWTKHFTCNKSDMSDVVGCVMKVKCSDSDCIAQALHPHLTVRDSDEECGVKKEEMDMRSSDWFIECVKDEAMEKMDIEMFESRDSFGDVCETRYQT